MEDETILEREDMKVALRLQPDACCIIIEFVEPGFVDPWRYKVRVTPDGIFWQEAHHMLPRLGGYEKKILDKVREFDDELPF